jgi:hypothetical protein
MQYVEIMATEKEAQALHDRCRGADELVQMGLVGFRILHRFRRPERPGEKGSFVVWLEPLPDDSWQAQHAARLDRTVRETEGQL